MINEIRNVIFDVDPNHLSDSMQENPRDERMWVVAPYSGQAQIYAPSKQGKHKGYHRIKCEIWIPEDAIKGNDILGDFRAFATECA
ncbi:hypothetical protein J2W98_000540 [Paenibacillus peoriae]|uniref:Uncharacterized protein n=2 Tax=Paenibacillus TaxID=44249 RepID=A0AAP3ZVH0_PAEPO|nr:MULTISPECIES: hypothetical protein [Paenibacillus]MDH2330462.1 hypothetical protein [Paenibacillus polymyxa]MDR6776293.1 hypothetical protein [Paenibacillus peoriae]